MFRYIKKRLVFNLLSLWIILTLTFLVMKTIPGDPFNDESSNTLSQETLQILKSRYGLNKPLYQQYIHYLKSLVTLDFGNSLVYKDRSVTSIISTAFPASAILGIESLILSISGGISLGTLAALRKKKEGRYILLSSILQISIPAFVLATMLQYIFAVKIPIFPIACWGNFSHTILPSLALAITPMAFITQLTFSSVSSVLNKDYVLLAYAKGLSPIKVILRHILPYAIFPTISYAAFLVTTVMTGTFAIENIFCIPGLGKWFVCSIKQRDYPVTLGLSVFYGAFFMLSSLLSDLIQAMIDPQLRYSYKEVEHETNFSQESEHL
ncbi:Oligopeptide transport system permease protein oppB,oligopeptide transporter permease,nickel ABC transporter, permease subunit NikB,Binding-protein-dependent transport system inner membrane component [Chlamydia poikilotherma]|uniref:Oligopeptide transport system permease protein oppB,oligopeptide transporter permease,nickel ABC transporter, permease subunit NikB,Binding-protein-dependent transport system inner membrane component n=1 Tax=Chlamydia poikilotherma TaxID=1967783 RepID=A0A3B0PSV4_9CHLA|nr:ABC transporter permease [Chlamydia poikilotherma]SYX09071.1 Oligopeptide transport system permease protein oppB,oligopeptide transporter permease,nickel ABC transporter, permease subunit NikB,Binding-protein-dependent transport system inner membrane component [Chlamydia poikilotherma]